jgi:alanine dehydrogenase
LPAFVRAGAHINAMGADAPGKQELDHRILLAAKVVIDDWEQATESGEVNVPLHEGLYRRDQIHGTLGEVVAGAKPGREGNEISVFDSTGLAIQDLAVARFVYDRARDRGLGASVELIP